jgi:pyrroloquinoline quinone (PQQ) biosynthesis protein C
LEWFKIHVNQEPDHTECADKMLQNLLPGDQQKAEEYAKEICMLWLDFFDALSAAQHKVPLQ